MDASCVVLGVMWLWIVCDASQCIRIGYRRRRQRRAEYELCCRITRSICGRKRK